MPTTKVKKSKPKESERSRYWRDVIESWKTSGLKASDYCRREGVSIPSFYWWKSELKRRGHPECRQRKSPTIPADKPSSLFLPISIPKTSSSIFSPSIELIHPSGWCIRVSSDFEESHLQRILRVVTSC